jgi:[ribosomal protein S5]-alanine N-acetyltransferase
LLKYEIQTDRLILKILDTSFYRQLVGYQRDNKDHFIHIYPELNDDFYSEFHQMEILRKEFQMTMDAFAYRYYIFSKEDEFFKKILGDISITNIHGGNAKSCKIGYKLDKDELGKGYMTEAMQKMIRFVFDELDLQRIEINIMPDNLKSIALAEKLGFAYEGNVYSYLKIQGNWEDHVRYSLIKAKYDGVENE